MTMTDSITPEKSRQSAGAGAGGSWSVVAVVEVASLALMIGSGAAAWLVGIFTRGYDYDEVLRAHSIWLTSRGLRPYLDFFEVHPPYFVLLSPLLRVFADPVDAMRALRVTTALGNVVFLGGLVRLGAMSLSAEVSKRWAWLGIAAVAFNPFILDYLVEFRIDGWGYAAIAWSTVVYCRGRGKRGMIRILTFGLVTAFASALLSPKMVLLPPLIMAFDLIGRFESWRGLVRSGIAYLAGVGLAASLFLAYLWLNGIGLERTILLLGRYHAVSNAHAGFRYGLFGQVVLMRTLLGLIVTGAAGWVWNRLRRRRPGGPYEPALAVWLAAQMLLVSYPYKQYYAPWFLFASGFVPSTGPILGGVLKGGRGVVYILACVLSMQGSYQIARFWAGTGVAASENAMIRWMNKVSSPEDRVIGSPPYHPIRREDTFFLSFNTSDPKGFDSERIFEELPGLRPFVTEDHYRAELEAHPPALVVLRSPVFAVTHPSRQRAIVEKFMLSRGYRTVRVGVVWFALRPDRYDQARRNGDLE